MKQKPTILHSNGIYKFENNINHMIYIGQASDLLERYKKHFLNIKDLYHQEDFYIGLRQYGWENFSFEILEEFPPTDYDKERLNKLEIYYIQKYHSLKPNGYNMTKGGNVSSEFLKKPVNQYSFKGEFVKSFKSILDASRILDINSSNISACCKGKRNHAGGYQWRYAEENLEYLEDISLKITSYDIPILQYDLYGNFIKEYCNLNEAEKETGISKSSICQVCKHKNKLASNFQWKYKNDDEYIIKNLDMSVYQLEKNTNKIINEFKTATEASQITGINRGCMGECLNKKRKSAGGFKWIYKKEYKIQEKENENI